MKSNFLNGGIFVKYKILTVILTLISVFFLSYGAKNLYFNSSYKVFFKEDNPQRIEYEKIQKQFTKTDNTIFILTPKNGELFSNETFKALHWLTKESWKIQNATRVDSLANFQHTKASEDDLIVADLIPNRDLNKKEIEEIKNIAFNDTLLVNRVIKKGSKTTGVMLTFNIDADDPNAETQAGLDSLALEQKFTEKFPNIEIGSTGSVMLGHAFSDSSEKDGQTIVPLMYLIILIITYLSLRSLLATMITLVIIIFSTLASLGVAGSLGMFFTSISAIVPTIILTLAVADSVHILKTMLELMKDGMSKIDAIKKSMELNAKPVFLTSLTTVIGFLGLNASEVPAYHTLGNMTAIGVTFAYLFSIITLPALAALLPIKVKIKEQEIKGNENQSRLEKLTKKVLERPKAIILTTATLFALSAIIIPRMEAYDEPLKYFSTSMKFRQVSDFAIDNLSGIENIEVSLPAKSGSIADPNYLKDLDKLHKHIEKFQDVVHVSTIAETVKKLNKSMNADNEDYLKIPESKELISQYLLLYSMSLPKGLELDNTIDLKKTTSKVVITFGKTNSKRVIELGDYIKKWIKTNTKHIDTPVVGSTSLMFANISKTNINSMIKGAIITFSMITLSLIFALGSLRYGLLSAISNILPSIFAFGIWSLFVGKVDIAVSVASTVTIDVLVDFTVHFLSKYGRYAKDHGTEESLLKTVKMVGPPILSTAVILAIGFGVLGLSPFRLNWVLGLLSALMIIIAVIFLFLSLPAFIKLTSKKQEL